MRVCACLCAWSHSLHPHPPWQLAVLSPSNRRQGQPLPGSLSDDTEGSVVAASVFFLSLWRNKEELEGHRREREGRHMGLSVIFNLSLIQVGDTHTPYTHLFDGDSPSTAKITFTINTPSLITATATLKQKRINGEKRITNFNRK